MTPPTPSEKKQTETDFFYVMASLKYHLDVLDLYSVVYA